MYGRQHGIWVGVFVVVGLLLFGVGLFLIGDRRLLFAEQREIDTTLARVTGLQVGTIVRVAGMSAGEVTRIDIPSQPSQPFVVRLRIRNDLAHLVRGDSVASVQTDGLVGNAFIQVSPGSDAATTVAPGGRIRGADPIEFSDMLVRANETLGTFDRMVQTIGPQVSQTLTSLNQTVIAVNGVVTDVGGDLKGITTATGRSLATTNRILDDVNVVVANVRSGRGTVGRLLNDDGLYQEIRTAGQRAAEGLEQFRMTSRQVRETAERLLRPGGSVDELLSNTQRAASATEEVLSDLSETTEAFKRNWLVRGFFRDRGYFDIDALTPAEYVRLADGAGERRTERLWLDAAVLFDTDAAGNERLTAEGRQRIDLAMGTLLQYRRGGPLVVEGYAGGESTGAQLLRSDSRARLVRDHLVRRFGRDATVTGALGLGADARQSPNGTGRWDGVALALLLDGKS